MKWSSLLSVHFIYLNLMEKYVLMKVISSIQHVNSLHFSLKKLMFHNFPLFLDDYNHKHPCIHACVHPSIIHTHVCTYVHHADTLMHRYIYYVTVVGPTETAPAQRSWFNPSWWDLCTSAQWCALIKYFFSGFSFLFQCLTWYLLSQAISYLIY